MISQVDPLVSFPATNLARAVRFYTEVLGCQAVVAEEEAGFYIFQLPAGHGCLGLHRHPGPLSVPDPHGIWVWVWVTSLEDARERLERQGIRFLGDPRELGPGREQAFVDTEGNVLRLYEPLDRVERSVVIEAPAAAVFEALTTAAAIELWFSVLDDVVFEARPGGSVRFRDPTFGEVHGTISVFEPSRRLAIEFTQNWPRRLEYHLTPEETGTRLEVRQSGFDLIRDRDFGIPGLIEHLDQALAVLTAAVQAGGMLLGAVEVAKHMREQLRQR
jgi:uncharacterized protein YndB with AHSA1/START domain/predicted enzyme related to lactoylglutathione lyase